MNTKVAEGYADFTDARDGPVFVKRRRSFSVEGISRSLKNFGTLSEA